MVPEGKTEDASFQPSMITSSSSHRSNFCPTLTRRRYSVKMPELEIDKNPIQRALKIGSEKK